MEILDYLNIDKDKNILITSRLPYSEVIYFDDDGIITKDGFQYYISFRNEEKAKQVLKDKDYEIFFTPYKYCADAICNDYKPYYQFIKKDNNKIDIEECDFRQLDESYFEIICSNYDILNRDDILFHIRNNDIYGLFIEDKIVGFIGTHYEGSMGMLKVFDEYTRHGYGYLLEAALINRLISENKNVYCHVEIDNMKSINLQNKLGLTRTDDLIYWRFYE